MFAALQKGLSKNYEQVEVSVVDCPDLTQKPFSLAASGKCKAFCSLTPSRSGFIF